jgi:thiosulfate/3-mercaptopyruvate sulfurtransferase
MHNSFKSGLISVSDLREILSSSNYKNLRLLDCTIPFNKGYSMYKKQRIPNAMYLDLLRLRDSSSNFTMTFPKSDNLKPILEEYNISKNNTIVFYDQYGIYSSPRAWFIFKAYKFPNVFVLNGGFPKWLHSKNEIENELLTDDNINKNLYNISDEINEKEIENQELEIDQNLISNFEEVLKSSQATNQSQIIDTRHHLNYELDHIPNSLNVPFNSLTNQDGTLKRKEELADLFEDIGINEEKKTIFSCGVGLTACIGMLAINEVKGLEKVKLYDGSFEEYSIKINN